MRFTRISPFALGLGAAIIATATVATSQSATPGDKAVAARQATMQAIGYHTGVLAGIAKGEMAFDQAMVDAAASNLRELAKLDKSVLFTAGTEQGAVEGSRAKTEIWSDRDGFLQGFTDLQNAAGAAVGASDAAAVGAAMAGIGGTCKDCHEAYRGPRN